MTTNRAWIRLPSGKSLDLINPLPGAWDDEDVSRRLARTYRWGGESIWPLPLSVAQHSLCVLARRNDTAEGTLSAIDQLQELLHDAEEGFLGFDCISPLKAVLGDPFKQVSERIMSAIRERYHLPQWLPDSIDYVQHKRIDMIVAASEAYHCIGWSEAEITHVLNIEHPILKQDPLQKIYGGIDWEPWPTDLAFARFHEKLLELIASAVPFPTVTS